MEDSSIDNIVNEINKITDSLNNRKALVLDKSKTAKYIWHHERMIEYEIRKIRELKEKLSKME